MVVHLSSQLKNFKSLNEMITEMSIQLWIYYSTERPKANKHHSQDLCLTRCILLGSDAGDGPALLTAMMRNWYSACSLRSGTLAVSWSPATSIAGSQSGLYLKHTHCFVSIAVNAEFE